MDTNQSLSHSKWECKYPVVFYPEVSPQNTVQAVAMSLGGSLQKVGLTMKSLTDHIEGLTTLWHRLAEVLNQERVMRQVVIVAFAIVFCVVYFSINRGIGFADESWQLVLVRDRVSVGALIWALFFSWLPDNLLVIQMVTVGLLLTGSLFFGYGLYSYFKVQIKLSKESLIPVMLFGFVGNFCFANAIILYLPLALGLRCFPRRVINSVLGGLGFLGLYLGSSCLSSQQTRRSSYLLAHLSCCIKIHGND
jgi:hypothetical protein